MIDYKLRHALLTITFVIALFFSLIWAIDSYYLVANKTEALMNSRDYAYPTLEIEEPNSTPDNLQPAINLINTRRPQ